MNTECMNEHFQNVQIVIAIYQSKLGPLSILLRHGSTTHSLILIRQFVKSGRVLKSDLPGPRLDPDPSFHLFVIVKYRGECISHEVGFWSDSVRRCRVGHRHQGGGRSAGADQG